MESKDWYVHIQGETFGPLTRELVSLMLRQNRLQFSDFIWSEGNDKWVRILSLAEFAELMPSYPKVALPRPHQTAGSDEKKKKDLVQTGKKSKVRRYARVEIAAKFMTADYGSFEVINISEGGVYVKSSTVLLPIGTNIVFKLESVEFPRVFDLSGVVVRFGSANDPPGFGVEFTRVTEDEKKLIRAFVDSRQPLA